MSEPSTDTRAALVERLDMLLDHHDLNAGDLSGKEFAGLD